MTKADGNNIRWFIAAVLLTAIPFFLSPEAVAAPLQAGAETAWWIWVLLLFVFSFFLGIVSVLAGVGGGVLFVPIVGSFFPFHLDFVRGAGLLVALSGALSAGPSLLRKGLADLKLSLPLSLIGSISSIAGAIVGLTMSADSVQLLLGIAIIAIAAIMMKGGKSGYPEVAKQDSISRALGISGSYYEPTIEKIVDWKVHRTPLGLVLFFFIGFIGGMFGMGAGWANVPVLNLLMGAPLKIAVATSGLVLSMNGAAAAWIYIYKGAVLPLIAVPAVGGVMLGSKIGARILSKVNTGSVRIVVIIMMVIAGLRSITKGLGL
ncbi:sulfite exporter TauE/SafE family protein [Chlorobium sp.]|uniref:sulfite exporter TauE/SafE family protein n=1 Tax=Chlorobium sp. TaxID=1095 RepID=UPI002F41980D